jgi:hypothetical protein
MLLPVYVYYVFVLIRIMKFLGKYAVLIHLNNTTDFRDTYNTTKTIYI